MNVYVLNTMGIGLDTISIISRQLEIKGVIGLSNRKGNDLISDFVYQREFCDARNLSFIEVDSYNLSKEADKKILLELEIDILLVTGWQRLVPDWFIKHCTTCVIGSHGSPLGITKGRGRSPQNWALMLGFDKFYISIFKIDAGIDSGEIIETRSFDYSQFDDIKTSYYKVCLITADMIVKNLSSPDFAKRKFERQSEVEAEYLPQRLPEDGKIDWKRSSLQIYNFVRALTRPYPGADSLLNGCNVKIWSVIPFAVDLSNPSLPGTIIKIFNKNDILVKTGDSFLLINDYSLAVNDFELQEGMQFESVDFNKQLEKIITRHQTKYPELPVSKIIMEGGIR